ncbi:MAG: hypothetical protein QW166_02955 [Candidatus Bathyarchaeia archaeon]
MKGYVIRGKSWISIILCALVIGLAPINVVEAEPVTEIIEHVLVNDLIVWIEYSYDTTNISCVTLKFTISPLYNEPYKYMPNLYIEFAMFEIMDISAPLNSEYSYSFNLTSEHALYSPNQVSTTLTVFPKVREYPPNYIRVYGILKFRHLESSEWTIANIPFKLPFSQYDLSSWWQLEADKSSLEASLSGSTNLIYAFAAATLVLSATTAFFGLEWKRQRKILKSIR